MRSVVYMMRTIMISMNLMLASCGMDIKGNSGTPGPQGPPGTSGSSNIIAFAYTNASGSMQSAEHLSVRPLIPGQYNYTFQGITAPRNYLVFCTPVTPCIYNGVNQDVLTCDLHFEDPNLNEFGVYIYNPGGTWVACDHSVLVISN